MQQTLAHMIEKISRYYPPAIISQEAFQKICHTAQFFPAHITKQVMFETELRKQTDKTDFAFYLAKQGNFCKQKGP